MRTFQTARFSLLLLSLTLLLGWMGCSKSNDSNPTPAANEIFLKGSVFSPVTLTVAVNTTVKWTNDDSMAHTVTSDSPGFDSGNLPAGNVFSHQFTTKGTFAYHCTYHSNMKATIIVQ